MSFNEQHVHSVLVLYRTLLRHTKHLPPPLNLEAVGIVQKEFRSHRKLKGRLLKRTLVECYDYEKQLFNFHKGKSSINPIEETISHFKSAYESRKNIRRIKRKPSILESYPEVEPEKIDKLKIEQRLEGLIHKLVRSDQSKSIIPHKSKLDCNYVNYIYGTRVIHMKSSQYFRKILKMYGPDSKPYDLKYSYNGSNNLTILSLRTPKGTIKGFDRAMYNLNRQYLDQFDDYSKFEEYQLKYTKWLQMQDSWDKSIADPIPGNFTDVIDDLVRERPEKIRQIENGLKFHNRKVMLVKSKLRPIFQRHHRLMLANLDQLVELISQSHVNEFNDYSTSLTKIMKEFGFTNKKVTFDFDKFEEKLDPKEFDWKVDN